MEITLQEKYKNAIFKSFDFYALSKEKLDFALCTTMRKKTAFMF